MEKQEILDRIVELAVANNGKPPGRLRFQTLTGIKESDWRGKYWARWSDAVVESGYAPNVKQLAYEKEGLLSAYLSLVVEMGRIPTTAELRLHSRSNPNFPGHNTFNNAFGGKCNLLENLLKYASENKIPANILSLIESAIPPEAPKEILDATPDEADGFVYLLKSGKYFKIGRTNKPDRRLYEIDLQLPEPIEHVHSIRTDDPSGIEAYWHNRFKDKRMKGEWFDLDAKEVKAFKKRKFM